MEEGGRGGSLDTSRPAAFMSELLQTRDRKDLMFPTDVHQLVIKEEVTWSSSLDQQDPEPFHIKQEQDDLWSSEEVEQLHGQEETEVATSPSVDVPVKSEDDEEEPESLWLHQTKTGEDAEKESPTRSSAEQMKSEADEEDCGGPEDPNSGLEPNPKRIEECFETEVIIDKDDDDVWQEPFSDSEDVEDIDPDWTETGAPESGVNGDEGCKTGRKSFSCSTCGRTFLYKHSLQRHVKQSSGPGVSSCCRLKQPEDAQRARGAEKRFGCDVCGKKYKRKGNLNVHTRLHTGDKPFGCDICGKRFYQKGNLNVHVRGHSGDKPFVCDVCGKRYDREGSLKEHLRVHTGEKPFGCDVCGKRFNQKGNLNVHLRVHTGDKPFSCEVCGKRYDRKENLKVHMRVHTGDKPFVCDHCGKRYNRKHVLQEHMSVHTGDRAFSCNVCGKRFAFPGSLRTHMVGHRSQKPFSCGVCARTFNQKGHLKKHMNVHSGDKTFTCTRCDKIFKNWESFQRHMKGKCSSRCLGKKDS